MRAAAVTALAAAALGMKDGQPIRKLGLQETMWNTMLQRSMSYGAGLLTYTLVVDSKRRLEARHVQMALEALQKQLPILRARVEERPDGQYMVASTARPGLTELPPGGDWLQHHQQRANHEVVYNGANGPHWKVALLHEPANTSAQPAAPHRAAIYLSIPHTFTDGLSQTLLLGQLLRYLDQAVGTDSVQPAAAAPVYPCMEEMLDKERITGSVAWHIVQTLGLMLRYRSSPFLRAYVADYSPERSGDSPCRMVTASLPADQLSRLRTKCRRHGVTVNAAMTAAVSLAGARMLAKTPDGQTSPGPYTLRTMMLVNLRRYLPAEVDRQQLYQSTVGAAASYVHVQDTSIDRFWPVAGTVHASLQRQIKMHIPIIGWQQIFTRLFKPDKWEWQKELDESSKRHYSPVDYNVNNLGCMDASWSDTTWVRPREVHRTYRQHPAMDLSFGSHVVQTVGGRLFYDLNYLEGRVRAEDAERFQALVMDVLTQVSSAED